MLTGHKWFCSAPMCDAFLVLAQAPGGLSCYLLPRVLPDGERNAFRIERLKDKLGNRSNASAEIELDGAWARLVGEEGARRPRRSSRWSTTRASTACSARPALMRRAVAEATHHAAHRSAFGRLLVEQPLMQNVLADLCLESEAATALAAAACARVRRGRRAPSAASRRRSRSTGSARRRRRIVAEALECLGGNGYVEESGLPRLYRESPLNSIWEGAGNVNASTCCARSSGQPESLEAVLAEVELAAGADARLDAPVAELRARAGRRGRRRAAGRGGSSSAWRSASRARCSCATARGGRRRLLRDAARRRRRPRLRHAAAAARTSRRSSSARGRGSDAALRSGRMTGFT